MDGDAAAAFGAIGGMDGAAVGEADGADDGEAEAGAVDAVGADGIGAEEALEDVREGFGRDAGAVVGDFEDGLAVGGAAIERNVAAGGGIFDGVIEEIDDDLLDAETVAGYLDGLRGLALDGDGFFLSEEGDLVGGGGDEFCEVETGDVDDGF